MTCCRDRILRRRDSCPPRVTARSGGAGVDAVAGSSSLVKLGGPRCRSLRTISGGSIDTSLTPRGRVVMSRKDFYQEAVSAIAPGVRHWLGKTQRAAGRNPIVSDIYLEEANALVGRLRALKARDDLIASIGAIQTADVADDGADALARVLVSLCGAVDVIAGRCTRIFSCRGRTATRRSTPRTGTRRGSALSTRTSTASTTLTDCRLLGGEYSAFATRFTASPCRLLVRWQPMRGRLSVST